MKQRRLPARLGAAAVRAQAAARASRDHMMRCAPVEDARDRFDRYEVFDEQVKFLREWFPATLPSARIERLAVLRLDGDLHDSIHDALDVTMQRVNDEAEFWQKPR